MCGDFKFIGESVDYFKLFLDQKIYEENYKTAGDFIYLPEKFQTNRNTHKKKTSAISVYLCLFN